VAITVAIAQGLQGQRVFSNFVLFNEIKHLNE